MKIEIAKSFDGDFTTRVAGEKLRKMILQSDENITLDFAKVKIASASFFDEGLAKLTQEGWQEVDFESRLKFLNLFDLDQKLLIQVCKARGIDLKI